MTLFNYSFPSLLASRFHIAYTKLRMYATRITHTTSLICVPKMSGLEQREGE